MMMHVECFITSSLYSAVGGVWKERWQPTYMNKGCILWVADGMSQPPRYDRAMQVYCTMTNGPRRGCKILGYRLQRNRNTERAHSKALWKQSLHHSAQARLAICQNQKHFLKSQRWMTVQNTAIFTLEKWAVGLKNRNYCIYCLPSTHCLNIWGRLEFGFKVPIHTKVCEDVTNASVSDRETTASCNATEHTGDTLQW